MATAVLSAAPLLAPRPSPWDGSGHHHAHVEAQYQHQPRPIVKQVHQPARAGRNRRDRPCDACRRRKSKCVLQPSHRCVLCEFHKQDCTFIEDAKPRKRKVVEDGSTCTTAGPTKAMAARRSSPITTPSLSSDCTTQSSTTPAPTASPLLQHQQSQQQQQQQRSPVLSTAAHELSPIATSPATMPRQAFGVDESLSLQRHRHCKYLGQTTALDASLVDLSTFDANNETESRFGTLRQVITGEYFSIHADADVPVPDDETRALSEIEAIVAPHGPALVDIYFRNVHPSYPIVQKELFLERHRGGDRLFNPPLLAAIYLLAIGWWESDSTLSPHPRPDVARLERVAHAALAVSMRRPKISALQAGLLLLQRGKQSTWTLTVQLVALGQDIGLHLDCSDWAIPLWERRLRKRLAWALYMQDKWSALIYGRPSHINAIDWAVPPLNDADFNESPRRLSVSSEHSTSEGDDGDGDEIDRQLARGRMLFMQMISLTAIMAEVCAVFYSQSAVAELRRAGRYATQLVLNRAKPVQIKLKDWFAKLPAECKIDGTLDSDGNVLSAAAGSLHLAYFATEITIHRRIVRSLAPIRPSDSGEEDNTPSPEPYMLYICRSAAKTRLISAMDFVNRLTPAHLQAFWFFASPANLALIGTFGALLQDTSPGPEEAAFYAARRREFSWTLGVSARRAKWIEATIEAVAASNELLEEDSDEC